MRENASSLQKMSYLVKCYDWGECSWVRRMKDGINIFDVTMQGFTAKEAMKQAIGYLETDSLNTIEIVTMDMLMREQENPAWKEQIQGLDMVLPGEREILEAAGIQDRTLIRDTEGRVFLKMFLKYLQKNRKKVFLLADSEEEAENLESAIHRYHRGIFVTGCIALTADSGQEERIINEINGTETECLLSALTSPWQEEFIAKQKALLGAKLWLGCGTALGQNYHEKRMGGKLKRFFMKRMFRYRVERQKKEN